MTIGAVFALSTSLLGAMFPLPRVLYAMANDGLIYKTLKRVNSRTKTPMIATLLAGLLAGLMALIFDLDQLIDMMSIGTLMAYTIVAICVLVLYYEVLNDGGDVGRKSILNPPSKPNLYTSNTAKIGVCVFSALCAALCGILKFKFNVLVISLASVVGFLILVTVLVLARQPADLSLDLSFRVPLVPYVPCLSILMNVYLMFQLDGPTWIRFVVWIVVGELNLNFYSTSPNSPQIF